MKCSKRLKKIRYPRISQEYIEGVLDKAHENLYNKAGEYLFSKFVEEVGEIIKNKPNVEIITLSPDVLQKALLDGTLQLMPEEPGRIRGYLGGVPVYVL